MNDDIEQSETIEVSYADTLREEIVKALQKVFDPEISINIYDLGLIYMLDVQENGNVLCEHTLTSMMCPFADQICQDISNAIKSVDGVTNVERNLVFDPPFSMDMMSEESKLVMGWL
jgi:metal-sulfur cluster biosynthetic enzyme